MYKTPSNNAAEIKYITFTKFITEICYIVTPQKQTPQQRNMSNPMFRQVVNRQTARLFEPLHSGEKLKVSLCKMLVIIPHLTGKLCLQGSLQYAEAESCSVNCDRTQIADSLGNNFTVSLPNTLIRPTLGVWSQFITVQAVKPTEAL